MRLSIVERCPADVELRGSASSRPIPLGFTGRVFWILLSCFFAVQQQSFANPWSTTNTDSFEAYQAADILQIRPEVDRLLRLKKDVNPSAAGHEDMLSLKAFILRKIFLGYLDARKAGGDLELEQNYTFDVLRREQRKQENVNQFLNVLNFCTGSVLDTIGSYSALARQSKQSTILSFVSSGTSIGFPVLRILYTKLNKAKKLNRRPMRLHIFWTVVL